MRNVVNKISNAPYRLMASTAVAFATMTEMAQAQTSTGGIGKLASGLNGQFADVGKGLLAGCFLGGVGFMGAGLLKLKAAADSGGQQVKYGEGIWRLGVGSGLVALPAVVNVGRTTFFTDGQGSSENVGTTVFTK